MRGARATLFVSMAGFGVGAPGQATVRRATVPAPGARRAGSRGAGAPAVLGPHGRRRRASPSRLTAGVFVIGPDRARFGARRHALRLGRDRKPRGRHPRRDHANRQRRRRPSGERRQPAVPAAGPGPGAERRPARGQWAGRRRVVEIDPATGRQLAAQWVDADRAQTPPGSGDLFGIALTPDRRGFYYVEDENNMLLLRALAMGGCPVRSRRLASRLSRRRPARCLRPVPPSAASSPDMSTAKGVTPASQGEGRLLTVPFEGRHQAGHRHARCRTTPASPPST